jgi:hypothetical protein
MSTSSATLRMKTLRSFNPTLDVRSDEAGSGGAVRAIEVELRGDGQRMRSAVKGKRIESTSRNKEMQDFIGYLKETEALADLNVPRIENDSHSSSTAAETLRVRAVWETISLDNL